jgi:hypothetical protein
MSASLIFAIFLEMFSAPRSAQASCPQFLIPTNDICSQNSLSIEGCANAIWWNLQDMAILEASIKRTPSAPQARPASITGDTTQIVSAARLLGHATLYGSNMFPRDCDATWNGIETCERQIRSARHGTEILQKPELATALSPAKRIKLEKVFRENAAQSEAQLDLIAASGQGDPWHLCNQTFAAVATCKRAIEADSAAIRDQVFPVLNCGQVVPAKFITAKDVAADAQRNPDHPEIHLFRLRLGGQALEDISRFYHDRLQMEKALLAAALQAR